MSKYGDLPRQIKSIEVNCREIMSYQYLPIKLTGQSQVIVEDRLKVFSDIIGTSCCDFIGNYGLDNYIASYVYITAKHGYQKRGCSYNRLGYHSDGFMTEDINYIWCDSSPTIFNYSGFTLTQHDTISLGEMETQAKKENEITYPTFSLLRLDQFNIHKVNENCEPGFRTFVKLSISKDKYDLVGNTHNYLLDYKWDMRPRKECRNIPQNNQLSANESGL